MSQTGPTSVLRDSNYNEVAVQDGVAVPAGQPIIPVAGTDGTNSRALQTDTGGNLEVVGTGVAGTPAGGVLTVQGDPAGTPIPVTATEAKSGTATETRVATSTTSATLLAANAARLGAVIVNDGPKLLYVKFGTTASATSYTYKLAPDDRVEVPFNFTGRIDAVLASGTGNAQITEFTT